MKNEIVLAIMQLKGISRKTIFKSFILRPDMECTVKSIAETIDRAILEDTKINCFSELQIKEAIEKADKIIKNCEENNIKIVTFLDEDYPRKLKNISDPPTILYYKGDIKCLNELNSVAIIGTREPTEYGMKIAKSLGASFGKRDYVVVSGLAIGCDAGGHEGCLDENGKTVAVMAGGLDKIYPAENKQLAQRIIDSGGCLISEYSPYTKIFKSYFVERDRLQSGLSDGVLVVETAEKGGTLYTVDYAIKYNRVLACYNHPSKFLTEEKTFGNQKLVKEGKAFAISDDVELKEFRNMMEQKEEKEKQEKEKQVNGTQGTIYDYMNG